MLTVSLSAREFQNSNLFLDHDQICIEAHYHQAILFGYYILIGVIKIQIESFRDTCLHGDILWIQPNHSDIRSHNYILYKVLIGLVPIPLEKKNAYGIKRKIGYEKVVMPDCVEYVLCGLAFFSLQ
jgi:hypothetical protein